MNPEESKQQSESDATVEAFRGTLANFSKLAMAMGITLPLGIVTKILMPRMLGSDQTGVLYFAESFPLFLLSFMALGIPAYIQKHVPPRVEHAWEIFPSVALVGAVVGFVMMASVLVFLSFSTFDQLTVVVTAIMTCYQALTIYTNEFLQRFFLSIGRYSFTSIMNVVSKVIVVVSIVVCLWFSGSVVTVAFGFLISQCVIFTIMFWKAWSIGLTKSKINVDITKKIVLVGLPFFFGGALNTVNASIDSLLLSRLATFKELGYYGAAQRLVGIFLLLTPILGQTFGPTLSRVFVQERERYEQLFAKFSRILVLMASPLAVFFTGFGPEIIGLLYGPDFLAAKWAFLLSGPMVLFSYLTTFFFVSATTTTNGMRFPLILGLGALINLVLDYLLIQAGISAIGPGGAAAGATVASLVATTIEGYLFLRLSGFRALGKSVGLMILLGTLPIVMIAIAGHAWFDLGPFTRIALLTLMYPPYLLLVRLVTRDDIVTVASLIRARLNRA